MSKKVTSKMLKDLINEVMSEEKRLNEIDISITDPSKWKDLKKDVGISRLSQLPQSKSDDALKALNDLAGLDGIATNITDKDLENAAATGGNLKATADKWYTNSSKTEKERSANPTLDQYLASLGAGGAGATADELQAAGLSTTMKGGKEVAVGSVGSWAQAVIDAAGTGDAGLAARLFQSFETFMYVNKGKSFPKSGAYQKAKKQLANPPAAATPADLQKDYITLIDLLNKGIAITDRSFTEPMGRMSVGSEIESTAGALAGAAKLRVKADSSMVEVFNSIVPNGSIEDKMNRLSQIGKDIEGKEDLSHLTDQEALEYANAMTVYGYLANAAKSFGSQAGGYEFEKIMSLLLKGAQVGGSNGAADVLSMSKDGKVFYSSKLLSDISTLEQALGGTDGVDEVLKKGPIIYLSGVKATGTGGQGKPQGEATEYGEIYWYIFKINTKDNVQWLNSSGDWDGTLVKMKNSTTHLKVGPKNFDKFFVKMPILDEAAKDRSDRAVAKRMVDFVDKFSKNDTLKAVKNAAVRLQNMERNTMEYRGVATKGATAKSALGLTPADYVKQVATDFTDIKEDFKTIFSGSISGASQTDLDKFNESKKITSKMLKKLISENFKK